MYLILLFSLLQGFTEFIPVSSQGHLILFNKFFNINFKSNITVLEANVIAHSGSLVAVCLYYSRQIFSLLVSLKNLVRPDIDKNSTLTIHLFIATIPILFCGFFFSKYFYYDNKSLFLVIGITSIFFGILLLVIATLGIDMLDIIGNIPFMRMVTPKIRTEMTTVFSTWREFSLVLTPGISALILTIFSVSGVFSVLGFVLIASAFLTKGMPLRVD